jgi:hypothetical protein
VTIFICRHYGLRSAGVLADHWSPHWTFMRRISPRN